MTEHVITINVDAHTVQLKQGRRRVSLTSHYDIDGIVRAVNAHDELVYRCQVLYRELGAAPEELGDVGLTALRLGITEMFERIGIPVAERDES